MAQNTFKSESVGMRPTGNPTGIGPKIITALIMTIVASVCALALIGGWDVWQRFGGKSTATPQATSVSQTTPEAKTTRTSLLPANVPLVPYVQIPTVALPKIGGSEKTPCKAVDNTDEGCASMKKGAPADYGTGTRKIGDGVIGDVTTDCTSGVCVKVTNYVIGDGRVRAQHPAGWKYARMVMDNCKEKGMFAFQMKTEDGKSAGFACGAK